MEDNIRFMNLEELTFKKKKLIKNILKIAVEGGSSAAHLGGALSSVDIITSLFFSIMNYNLNNYNNEKRDRFILSKGHACLVLYSALLEKKIINWDQVSKFEKDNSDFPGHPVKNLDIGIEFSTGSLGMGIGLAIGVALGLRQKKHTNKIFVLLGDGECNEGSVWEGLMTINHHKLKNITIIVDKNNFQQTGKTEEIITNSNLKEKFKSFGINTKEIDGHSLKEINSAFLNSIKSDEPSAIIANTIKGHGVKLFENDNKWHHSILTKELYEECLRNL